MERRAVLTVPTQMPDGTVTPVRVFTGTPAAPVVIIWPGIGLPASFYDPLAEALVDRGFNAVTGELRGQGASAPRPDSSSAYGYHELASVDYPAVMEVAREHFPDSIPFLLGHSVGGHVALMYAARVHGLLGGLILVATPSPYFRGYPGARGLGALVGGHAASFAADVFGYFPGDRLGMAGLGPQPRTLVSDWTRFARTGRISPIGADIDYEREIAELDLPVLSISIAGDELAPGAAIRNLVGKLANARITQWRNPLPLGHNRWAREPAGTADQIAQWIRDVV
jgi:predicted alpha/beta hydrolase